MTVHGNDMGIYTDDGVTVTGDNASGNRDVGIYVDADAAGPSCQTTRRAES